MSDPTERLAKSRDEAAQRRNEVEACRRQTAHARVRGGKCRCGLVVFDPSKLTRGARVDAVGLVASWDFT